MTAGAAGPEGSLAFEFAGPLWLAEAADAWVFLSLPAPVADEIADAVAGSPGFGSVKVRVTLGGTTWSTSVFPDTKEATYLLPVKKAVRSAEGVDVGDDVTVRLEVVPDP